MTARHKLLKLEDVYDQKNSSGLFLEAMRECLTHHIENCEFFRKLCDNAGFMAQDLKTEKDLEKIPPIHANFFKKYEVLSVPFEKITEYATSSGTGGQKSQMFFDKDSFDFGNSMIEN